MSSSPQTNRPVVVPQPSPADVAAAAPKKSGRAPFVLVPEEDDRDLEPQWTAAIDSATD